MLMSFASLIHSLFLAPLSFWIVSIGFFLFSPFQVQRFSSLMVGVFVNGYRPFIQWATT